MTRNTRATGGFAPLSAHYYKDDAILSVGPMAELLFVRSLAFCTEVLSDGYISHRQLMRLVAPDLDDVQKLAEVLIEEGLWERAAGGYLIRSWLKWNRSREEIVRGKAKDAARKRGGEFEDEVLPASLLDVEPSNGAPDGFQTDSSRTPPEIGQPDTPTPTTPDPSSPQTLAGRNPESKFPIFWASYPRKVDKRNAEKAWNSAMKRGVDPDRIIAAARTFAESVADGDARYIKYPSSWLNAGAYDNEPEPRSPPRQNGHQPYKNPKPEDYSALPDWGDES